MVSKNIFIFIFIFAALNVRADEIIIGVEDDAAPWSYKDGSGFANDVVRLTFKAVGTVVKFDVYPYARCKFQAEKGGRVACLTSSRTTETEQTLMFPKNSLLNVQNILFVRKNSANKTCDISKWPKPLHVIYTNEYEYVEKFGQYIKKGIISGIKVNTESQGLVMLQRKRADAVIINVDEVKTINYVLNRAGIKESVAIGCDLGVLKGYLAFSKKNPKSLEAMEKFDRGFEIIKKNGELKKLQLLWRKLAIKKS